MKRCTRCLEIKADSEFYRSDDGRRHSHCRDCRRKYKSRPDIRKHHSAYLRAYKKKNKKRLTAYNRRYEKRPEVIERRRERDRLRYWAKKANATA